VANIQINIPGSGTVSVPEWATEDSLQSLLQWMKINSSSMAGSSNRRHRQTIQQTQQSNNNVVGKLKNVYDATIKNYSTNSNILKDLKNNLSTEFIKKGGGIGLAVDTMVNAIGSVIDVFKELEAPLMALTNVGVGLNASLRDITSGALQSGQTLDQFSNTLIAAGTGLQVLQDSSDDAGQAAVAYGDLISSIKNATREHNFYGMSLDQINQITNDQLELARLEGLQTDNIGDQIQKRVLEVATVTTNLARQTNRDRQSLIDAVQDVVRDDDLLAYMKAQGDPELMNKLSNNIAVLSAGLGPDVGNAIAGILTKSISQGIPLEGVSPMIAELGAITGGQSNQILRDLQQAIQQDDTARVAELTNQFSNALRDANTENQQLISIMSNQNSEAARFLQQTIAQAQPLTADDFTKFTGEIGDTTQALDRAVLGLRDLRLDYESFINALKVGGLGITASEISDLFGGSNTDTSMTRDSIEGVRNFIAEMLETTKFGQELTKSYVENNINALKDKIKNQAETSDNNLSTKQATIPPAGQESTNQIKDINNDVLNYLEEMLKSIQVENIAPEKLQKTLQDIDSLNLQLKNAEQMRLNIEEFEKETKKSRQREQLEDDANQAMKDLPSAVKDLAIALKETDPNMKMIKIDEAILKLDRNKMNKRETVGAS
jgi:hypothetical protein